MRFSKARWYAPLLEHPESTAFYAHKLFPTATTKITKKETPVKMVRHFEMYVEGHLILRGRSEVDINQTDPALLKKLRETNEPLGLLVRGFHVRRTRVRATSRTREYHFVGDLHGKVWERFFTIPAKKK